tara:strand:+ start:66 stop:296 length:231 start_codon:yes stop_codon:yes gene_type:complete
MKGLACTSPGAYIKPIESNHQGKTMNRKLLMNLQGMTFTEEGAREYYGSRFETAELVWVVVDEDGQVVEGKREDRA